MLVIIIANIIRGFINTNFNLEQYINTINGFIRFECEIKKKMLLKLFDKNLKHIKVLNINYEILKKVWCEEFMKLLKFIKSDLDIVYGRENIL